MSLCCRINFNSYICSANVNERFLFRRATVIGSNIHSGIFYALIRHRRLLYSTTLLFGGNLVYVWRRDMAAVIFNCL